MDRTGSTKQLNMYRLKHILFSCLLLVSSFTGLAQNADQEKAPVKLVFWGQRLADQQTTQTNSRNKFRIEVLHRFGTVENGMDDIFGVYAPSNISMGVGYGVTDKLDLEFQSEKNNKVQELGVKYNFLQQNISNTAPLSLSYYFNISLDANDSDNFGDDYKFSNRLFFTNQIIASRQFRYKFMAMMSLSYVHFNSVNDWSQHDKMELNTAIGYKLNKKRSVFVSYQLPTDVTLINNNLEATTSPQPAINFGIESTTPSHNFQVFMTTRDNISVGQDLINNQNKIALKNLRLGFNIRINIGSHKNHS